MEIKPLKKEDRKFMMEVHQSEFELLKRIREKYQFGEITIETLHGLPCKIKRVTEYDKTWVYSS
jgi:hypothetical protein